MAGIWWSLMALAGWLPDLLRAVALLFFILDFPGVVFGMAVSGNPHGGDELWNTVGVFIQWTILGYFLASFVSRRRKARRMPSS
jgi:hypothetical protein